MTITGVLRTHTATAVVLWAMAWAPSIGRQAQSTPTLPSTQVTAGPCPRPQEAPLALALAPAALTPVATLMAAKAVPSPTHPRFCPCSRRPAFSDPTARLITRLRFCGRTADRGVPP